MEKAKKGCGFFLLIFGSLIALGAFGSMLRGGNTNSSNRKNDSAINAKNSEENGGKKKDTTIKDKTKKDSEDNVFECEYNDTILEYKECNITEDDLGSKVFVLYFDFTNNSNENKAFDTTYSLKPFQNGIEMEDTYVHVGQETRNASADIQPGNTVTVAEAFEYSGDKSKIDVEVQPWVSLTENKLIHFTLKFK